MLSYKILTRKDINRAASYYEDSADDYYAKDGEFSKWQGSGAKNLKLSGEVDKTKFRELLDGKIASENAVSRTSTRNDNERRIGIDLTFSAPKSVSMQALIAQDASIIKAHDKAVTNALRIVERQAQTRKKINGKSYVETTGNLIIAKFRHETSRERDPQLHTHAVVMNLTKRKDGEWRALRNDEIIKMTKYLGGVYRSELAIELKKIGYQIRYEPKGLFELDHISREQIEGFSKRSYQIEKKLAAQGLSRITASTKQKQQATLETRRHKILTEREIIFNEWKIRAKELEINFDRQKLREDNKEFSKELESLFDKELNNKNYNEVGKIEIREIGKTREVREAEKIRGIERIKESKKQKTPDIFARTQAAERAVRFAANHLTERQAVINERTLIDTAIKHEVGAVLLSDIKRELRKQIKNGYLIREDFLYVSLQEIKAKGVKDSSEKVKTKDNIKSAKTKDKLVEELTSKGIKKPEAKAYVNNAIKQGSLIKIEPRYIMKNTLLQEKSIIRSELKGRESVTPIIEQEQVNSELEFASKNLNQGQFEAAKLIATTQNRIVGIQGFAGTGKSHMLKITKEVIEKSGYNMMVIAPYGGQVKALDKLGIKANTVHSFLYKKDQNINKHSILVIDEAGVVPTRLMEQTMKDAEKVGARVVLIGDIAQTKAIEAGKPFEQLQKAGMKTVYMDQIQRQENQDLKKAVELVISNEPEKSLQSISNITEINDDIKRRAVIAKDYVKLLPNQRENTIIVSGTNEARSEINKNIRKGLELEGQGIKTDILIKRDITKEEQKYSKNYHVGDIIKPERDYEKIGLKSSEFYRIESTGTGNHLTVRMKDKHGESIKFSPIIYKNFSVYKPDAIEISKGDLVRITRNDKEQNVVNGDRFKVEVVKEDHILLSSSEGNGKSKDGSSGEKKIKLTTDKPLYIDYAYATTLHSSQGLTAERVLIDADTKSITTSKETYYVAISRAKKEASIYTDNVKELPRAITREHFKPSAMEIVRDRSNKGNSGQELFREKSK